MSERTIINRHFDLDVYKRAFAVAMRIFELTKTFPMEERYSLTDQVRRSSRADCKCIYGKVARPPVRYGERQRPEHRLKGFLIDAQVADAIGLATSQEMRFRL